MLALLIEVGHTLNEVLCDLILVNHRHRQQVGSGHKNSDMKTTELVVAESCGRDENHEGKTNNEATHKSTDDGWELVGGVSVI